MKKFFTVLGVILILIGGVGLGVIAMRGNPLDAFGFWFLSMRTRALDNESKAYADVAIPAIVATWNEKELVDRESPEFKQSVTQQQLDQIFQRFAVLGRLQKCEPAQGGTIISIATREFKAEYVAKATFEKGEAVVGLSLIKHKDQWQIHKLSVNSPVLQQQQQQQAQQQQPQQQQH